MDFIVFTIVAFYFMVASTTASKLNNFLLSETYVVPLSDKYLQEVNLDNVKASNRVQKSNDDDSIWIAIVPDRMIAKKANAKKELSNPILKTNVYDLISDKRAEIIAEKNKLKKLHKKLSAQGKARSNAKGIARSNAKARSNDNCPLVDIFGQIIPKEWLGPDCALNTGLKPRNADGKADKAVKNLVLNFDYGKANGARYWLSKSVPADSEVCEAAYDKEGHHIFGYHKTKKVCKDGRWKGISLRSGDVLGWQETERTKYHFLPTDKLKSPADASEPSFYEKLPFKVIGVPPLKVNGNNIVGWSKLSPPHWSADVVPADAEDCSPINDGEGNFVLGFSYKDKVCKDTRFSKLFDESDVEPDAPKGNGRSGDKKVIGWKHAEHDDDSDAHPCYDDLGRPIQSDMFKSICDGTENNVIVDDHKYHSEMLPYSDRHPLRQSFNIPEIFDHKFNDDDVVLVVV